MKGLRFGSPGHCLPKLYQRRAGANLKNYRI